MAADFDSLDHPGSNANIKMRDRMVDFGDLELDGQAEWLAPVSAQGVAGSPGKRGAAEGCAQ